MKRTVVRPRIQVPLLVLLFTVLILAGISYFTAGDVVARRQWFGIICGCVAILAGTLGVWRALRLGVVIDGTGIRVRGFDSRDQVIPWNTVSGVEWAQMDTRAGLPLYAPVIDLGEELGAFAVLALGTYSRHDVERKVDQLRGYMSDAKQN